MRKTTSSVSAASIQLRNRSCMVGSRPPGPARAGEKSWSGGAQRQAPEPRRAAGRHRCAPGESGPAAAAAAADKGCSGAASLLARSARVRPSFHPPLPSGPAGRAQFDSFARALLSSSHSRQLQCPASGLCFSCLPSFGSRGRWNVAGASHSPLSWAQGTACVRAPSGAPRKSACTARRSPPPGKRPPLNLCPAPLVSRKVFPTQRPTPGNSPRRAARSWFQPGRCFSS